MGVIAGPCSSGQHMSHLGAGKAFKGGLASCPAGQIMAGVGFGHCGSDKSGLRVMLNCATPHTSLSTQTTLTHADPAPAKKS